MKHLSTLRKRDYSLSSGERKGKSPNSISLVVLGPMLIEGCKASKAKPRGGQGVTNRTLVEGLWKGQPQKVTVL